MTAEAWVAVFGAVCGSGVLAALITSLFSKKRMGAEAAEIITKAAAGVVSSMEADLLRHRTASERMLIEHAESIAKMQANHEATIAKMQADNEAAMTKLADSHAEEMDEVRRVLQLHVAWDAIAIAEMSKLGVELPPAPPLLPARRFDHPVDESTLEG